MPTISHPSPFAAAAAPATTRSRPGRYPLPTLIAMRRVPGLMAILTLSSVGCVGAPLVSQGARIEAITDADNVPAQFGARQNNAREYGIESRPISAAMVDGDAKHPRF